MKASATSYKGIHYVQISSLPIEQKNLIRTSINRKLIISILKENELLTDCVQYHHYVAWHENVYAAMRKENVVETQPPVPSMSLAFK